MPTPPENRVQELHLTLPPVPKPVAKYRMISQVGKLGSEIPHLLGSESIPLTYPVRQTRFPLR